MFQNVAMPTYGGTLYVSLHTASPGEAGNQTTNEATYTNYARVAVTRDNTGWTVSGNQASNAALTQFPKCTGGANTITDIGIGNAASGSGYRSVYGQASSSTTGIPQAVASLVASIVSGPGSAQGSIGALGDLLTTLTGDSTYQGSIEALGTVQGALVGSSDGYFDLSIAGPLVSEVVGLGSLTGRYYVAPTSSKAIPAGQVSKRTQTGIRRIKVSVD